MLDVRKMPWGAQGEVRRGGLKCGQISDKLGYQAMKNKKSINTVARRTTLSQDVSIPSSHQAGNRLA